MLAWSFVRDDQPLRVTADQVALALREEIAELEQAGIAIVQVDEPALRELLPIRPSGHADLDWSVRAFGLATGGVAARTQIHTHLCYSEFGEIMDAIERLDADVTSIEAARSNIQAALKCVPTPKLWVNPDGGLKTRAYGEIKRALANLVAAAHAVRAGI